MDVKALAYIFRNTDRRGCSEAKNTFYVVFLCKTRDFEVLRSKTRAPLKRRILGQSDILDSRELHDVKLTSDIQCDSSTASNEILTCFIMLMNDSLFNLCEDERLSIAAEEEYVYLSGAT